MRILVAYATRHGATKGIAERIAETLEADGLRVTLSPVERAGGQLLHRGGEVRVRRRLRPEAQLADRGPRPLLLGRRVLERPHVLDRQHRDRDAHDQQHGGDPVANHVAHPRNLAGLTLSAIQFGRWTSALSAGWSCSAGR